MIDTALSSISNQNQQIYQRLKLALGLDLRRQIFVAVCDDLALQSHLSAQLDTELAYPIAPAADSHTGQDTYPRLVTLTLDLSDPNPVAQIARWLSKNPPPRSRTGHQSAPGFQILGIEKLTRQPASVQWQFLSYLRTMEQELSLIESSLLLWLPRPWFHSVQQSAPEFWNLRTGFFEFAGDPTPIAALSSPADLDRKAQPTADLTDSKVVELNRTEPTYLKQDQPEKPDIWDILTEDLAKLGDNPSSRPASEAATTEKAIQPESRDSLAIEAETETAPPHETANSLPVSQPRQYQFLKTSGQPAQVTTKTANRQRIPQQGNQRPVQQPQRAVLELGNLLPQPQDKVVHLRRDPFAPPKPTLQPVASPLKAAAAPVHPPAQVISPSPLSASQLELWRSLIQDRPAQRLLEEIEQLGQQPASNLELAIACRNLGNYYRDRVEQGEGSDANLNLAIQAYEQVLICLDHSSLPLSQTAASPHPLLPDVLNDLGNLYWMLSRQLTNPDQKLGQLSQSIETYRAALKHLDVTTQSMSYAMIQNNLGAAYGDLARHQDTVDNLQQSIAAYQEALRHRQPAVDPLKYASTQNNLGTAYWHLAQHQQPKTRLREAIAAYSDALQYYNPEQEPLNYAMIQNNLGTAYWNLAQFEQPDKLLELAVTAYQAALVYRTAEAVPTAHAATQNNLGTAYWHLAGRSKDNPAARQDYLQQAIVAYTAAIQTAHRVTSPLTFDVFATQNNLGLAYYQMATDKQFPLEKAQRSAHLEAALHHHLQALQGWQAQPEYYQTALGYVMQTIRAFYNELGLQGQNLALSKVPGHLLREILPRI
ncbi:hypothetical protein BST81_06895 [Leptolyngbya sp. 'hensonii']|uniref:tetratricopeptide repeat protein n=1 Tax=Leptolyngbya sp. 'hensonii' TaxID=1922337 RepID=UPI0009501197|nr:tetratricopeptide repeat protein [Leptolyngbya sp. 'hensonii']OLP18958.1 hypothetical protein BST81_06895 [Leptolyngbya sp. 'hensonii']